MATKFTVTLANIVKEFSLEVLFSPDKTENLLIDSNETNRPGLQFCGYYEYYDCKRIQVLGRSELSYLYGLSDDKYLEAVDKFFETKPVILF